jgi:hypothetical protein
MGIDREGLDRLKKGDPPIPLSGSAATRKATRPRE